MGLEASWIEFGLPVVKLGASVATCGTSLAFGRPMPRRPIEANRVEEVSRVSLGRAVAKRRASASAPRAAVRARRGQTPSAKLLCIYLQDHFAGSRAGLDLARRCAQRNEDTSLGEFLRGFVNELKLDRDLLRATLARFGGKPSKVKQTGARLADMLGRLKLNGRIATSSPLSVLVELEALTLGVRGKLGMWRVLSGLVDRRIDSNEIEAALTRAIRQHTALEQFRLAAAGTAFAPGDGATSGRRRPSADDATRCNARNEPIHRA